MSNLLKKEKGFTLIEIVLVLAIAGLLLVVVFLAVSGAQKSRRDSARKNDAANFVTLVESSASNNNGALPADGATPAGFTRTDPTNGTAYTVAATVPTAVGQIQYLQKNICASGAATTTGAKNNNYAVVIYLESGATACYDNH